MRIAQTADLHLRTTDDDRWDALAAAIDAALAHDAGVLAISGDLFDRDIDAQELRVSIRGVFERFARPIVLIPGNHDINGIRDGDFYGDNVTVIAGEIDAVAAGGVNLIGVPFAAGGPGETLAMVRDAARLVSADASNVLLYHGELLDLVPEKGAFGDEPGRDYMPVRLRYFDNLGIDYVLAGHFHSSHRVHSYDGGYFVYSGSPVSITRKETGRRHITIVDPGEPPRPVPLDTRHYVELKVVLSPDADGHPIEQVERVLNELHPAASPTLTVTGFADLARFESNEAAFHEQLKLLAAKHQVYHVESLWQDVGTILRHELYVRFKDRLNRLDLGERERAAADNIAISAMMEAIHAR